MRFLALQRFAVTPRCPVWPTSGRSRSDVHGPDRRGLLSIAATRPCGFSLRADDEIGMAISVYHRRFVRFSGRVMHRRLSLWTMFRYPVRFSSRDLAHALARATLLGFDPLQFYSGSPLHRRYRRAGPPVVSSASASMLFVRGIAAVVMRLSPTFPHGEKDGPVTGCRSRLLGTFSEPAPHRRRIGASVPVAPVGDADTALGFASLRFADARFARSCGLVPARATGLRDVRVREIALCAATVSIRSWAFCENRNVRLDVSPMTSLPSHALQRLEGPAPCRSGCDFANSSGPATCSRLGTVREFFADPL